ncbi:hypothetical protein WAB17_05005 [Parerythrobacter aurantius]|uniref:hypothetical protein n=1 Tax=Parerythrobacter aurantius TaxID=3127706 RepID=UPI0032448103
MSDTDSSPGAIAGDKDQTDTLAPENTNAEQSDEGAQAQTVAEDAITRATSVLGTDSTHVRSNFDAADAQDLVDHMKQMDRSGVIDMSAYKGEPNHDDDEDAYGNAARPDDEPADDELAAGDDK